MAEKDLEAKDIERKVHDLAEAMREVKTSQADRDDVVVEMRHAKFSRLELLAEDLTPVFNDVPNEVEMFDFALTKGEIPRLWVDMTSFVRLGKDGRTYEFVKDTRLGRTILGTSSNREKIGKRITDYVAERLLERERMIEGEWISPTAKLDDTQSDSLTRNTNSAILANGDDEKSLTNPKRALSILSALMWFLFGIAIIGCVIAGLFVFDQLQPLSNWLAGAGNS